MNFLTRDDFDTKLSEDIVSQIIETDDTILDDAELQATAIIEDALSKTYDLDAEFAKTDTDRHKNLLRWMMNLAVYFIYERIPSNQVPDRVVKNYDDTIAEIKGIESGKRNTSLTLKVDETTGKTNSVFRFGSNLKRSHNP
jgi:phage gp36-like protein